MAFSMKFRKKFLKKFTMKLSNKFSKGKNLSSHFFNQLRLFPTHFFRQKGRSPFKVILNEILRE